MLEYLQECIPTPDDTIFSRRSSESDVHHDTARGPSLAFAFVLKEESHYCNG